MSTGVETFLGDMSHPSVFDLDDHNFTAELARPGAPLLVDFTAPWCPPCRLLEPTIAAVAEAHAGRLRVARCDVDASPAAAERFGVRSVPTLLLFDGGTVRAQLVGAVPRARIEEMLAAAGAKARADGERGHERQAG